MAKAVLICGRICSGKSRYARQLRRRDRAVILSADEATYYLCGNRQGELCDKLTARVKLYLQKKAADTVGAGCDVILDWGFWTAGERREISGYFSSSGIRYEWHYIDIDKESLAKNIRDRNRLVAAGCGGSDFYVDSAPAQKCDMLFEMPAKAEIDVWHRAGRQV